VLESATRRFGTMGRRRGSTNELVDIYGGSWSRVERFYVWFTDFAAEPSKPSARQ
jgi:hypothetical protein